MNTDFYCEMGETHLMCQDYAIAGHINNDIAYAIVSDGCSSSVDVDVGARILTHMVKNYLYMRYGIENHINPSLLNNCSKEFRKFVSSPAIAVSEILRLQEGALDATLISAICDGKTLHVSMYGDGGFILKHKDGRITYRFVEFESGAPYYLSYTMNAERRANYLAAFPKPVNVGCMHLDICNALSNVSQQVEVVEPLDGIYDKTDFVINLADDPIASVSLVSDGIRTYRVQSNDGGNVVDVPVFDMVKQFVDFKNFAGTFTQRRMHKIKQSCRQNNITHYDDVSVATIHIS